MNKREKTELISQIARWEWQQGGSTSQAAAINECIATLCTIFKLSDEDLQFDRVWEMGKTVCARNGTEMGEEWFQALDEMVEDLGYQEVVSLLEVVDWENFYNRVCEKEMSNAGN